MKEPNLQIIFLIGGDKENSEKERVGEQGAGAKYKRESKRVKSKSEREGGGGRR